MVRGVSCDCVRASLEPNRAHCVRRNRPPIICEAINWTNPGGILLTLRRINVPPAVFNALRIMAIKGDQRINSGRTSTLWQNKQKASLSGSDVHVYVSRSAGTVAPAPSIRLVCLTHRAGARLLSIMSLFLICLLFVCAASY